ncbi:MAG: tRNA lysidine(34) synthetase TilS [Actinobacteria bacterium]|nr:tRNA lysidine(34) synthetase TilS [Actinomycetota bacterium]
MPLRDKVLATINKFAMIRPGDRILVAVSGGPDSVALVHLLIELSGKLDLTLTAFHLDHRLRAESANDSIFVAELCNKLGIQLESMTYDLPAYLKETGLSVEDGARRIRYRLLEETADRLHIDRIALGHQADDQVETFLMRIIRGAGPAGLTAIPPTRGRFIRPLIEVSKEEILAYLGEIGEGFVIDASNEDISFFRNRVRRRLIPEILTDNPAFKEVIRQTIELIGEDEALLEGESEKKAKKFLRVEQEAVAVVSAATLVLLPPAIARRIVRRAIERVKGDLLDIEFRHVKGVLSGLAEGSLRMDLPGDLIAAIEGGDLVVGPRRSLEPPPSSPVEIKVPGVTDLPDFGVAIRAEIVPGKGYEIRKDLPLVAQLDADLVGRPLIARSWRPGDSFNPLGLRGEKKLQDFFVDEKVPRRHRLRIPVIEGAGRILWVAGMRIGDRFKVTRATGKVLLLKLVSAGDSKGN